MEIQFIHNLFLKCSSLSIDTRKIQPNSFFVAIKGERFDANTFATEALEKGASYVLIDNVDFFIDHRTLLVENSLSTLQELAKFHRNYLKLPVIALTGSNGKTTTKELINCILSKKYTTKATVGNLNNHIGVPLTLLSFTSETEIGIVEMGANHQKEIEFLCAITQPDYGYITNFGKAHLEGFGGVDGVIQAKSEMYDYLSQKNKTVFVNLEDPIQVEKTRHLHTFSFGINRENADVNIKAIRANPFVEISFGTTVVTSRLIGLYNANNINAAVAIGKCFAVEDNTIKEAIENYIPSNNRSQLIAKKGNRIILDAYNANPSSMEAAIDNFIQLDGYAKIAILGDMFELGNESLAEHKKMIELLRDHSEIVTYFVGAAFFANRTEESYLHFYPDFENFAAVFKTVRPETKQILIKGSRGMALERTLELI